jgi:hypothetical protein
LYSKSYSIHPPAATIASTTTFCRFARFNFTATQLMQRLAASITSISVRRLNCNQRREDRAGFAVSSRAASLDRSRTDRNRVPAGTPVHSGTATTVGSRDGRPGATRAPQDRPAAARNR